MKVQVFGLAAAAVLSAGAAQAASVELRDAVARVTVIPEDRRDVRVEVVKTHPELPLRVREEGGRTVIDGELRNRIRGCGDNGARGRVQVRGIGQVAYDEMPQVVIRTPRNVEVSTNGAVSGAIGRSAGLTLTNSGCSHWTVADVAGPANLRGSGAGSVRMGAAERLNVSLSGAGSVRATRVSHSLDASLSGAGGVTVQELRGAMDARVSGVGSIDVEGGRATTIRASVSGVGGVEFDGEAQSLDASVSGIGGVRVRSVSGPVHKRVSGIGRVSVGRGR
jgi:hypothetical protein